jgi:hypothetical protein
MEKIQPSKRECNRSGVATTYRSIKAVDIQLLVAQLGVRRCVREKCSSMEDRITPSYTAHS